MNKQDALQLLEALPEDAEVNITFIANPPYVTSGYIIDKLKVSRQSLSYWSKQGYVRTVPHGKQKRYLLEDILKIIG